jgi:hypothetical protein
MKKTSPEKKTPVKTAFSFVGNVLSGALSGLSSSADSAENAEKKVALKKEEALKVEKAAYLRKLRKVNFTEEPLLPPYQAERERLSSRVLSVIDLAAEIFQGINRDSNPIAEKPLFCSVQVAYFVARNADTWCKINPFLDCEIQRRDPDVAERQAMLSLVSVSPLFYLKSLHPFAFGDEFDELFINSFRPEGDVEQYFEGIIKRVKGGRDSPGELEKVQLIEATRDKFISDCRWFFPQILVGERFCDWVAVHPVEPECEAISRLALWRWGRLIDGLIGWFERLDALRTSPPVEPTVEGLVGGLQSFVGVKESFSKSWAAKIFAEQLILILSNLGQQNDFGISFRLLYDEQSLNKASNAKHFGYHLLLNLTVNLHTQSYKNRYDSILGILPMALDITLKGTQDKKIVGLCAHVLNVSQITVDRKAFSLGFKHHLETCKSNVADFDALMSDRNRGLQKLLGSPSPAVIELGRQLLWSCNPAQRVMLASRFGFSGPFFCSDVLRFCIPLLKTLRQHKDNQDAPELLESLGVLQVIEAIASDERVYPKLGVALSSAHNELAIEQSTAQNLATMLVLYPEKTHTPIANYLWKNKKESLFFKMIADRDVSIAHVNNLLGCFQRNDQSILRLRHAITSGTGIPVESQIKMLLSDCSELVGDINTQLCNDFGDQLRALFCSENYGAVLAEKIFPVLESYVKIVRAGQKVSPIFNGTIFSENIESFLMCMPLRDNQDFIACCCVDIDSVNKVLDIITRDNFDGRAIRFLCALLSGLCDLVAKKKEAEPSFFLGPTTQFYLRRLIDKNPVLNKLLFQYGELVRSLYLDRHLKEHHWALLVEEISAGRLRELLDIRHGLGASLWSKLSHALSRNTVEAAKLRESCFLEEGFTRKCLAHLSQEQRESLFKLNDEVLIAQLLKVSHEHFPHLIYSVLNHFFRGALASVESHCFYKALAEYPRFLEYAVDISKPRQLNPPLEAHVESQSSGATQHYSAGHARLFQGLLEAIVRDEKNSVELSDELVKDYFHRGDTPIHVAMFANPILMHRLLAFREAGAVKFNLVRDIMPLLKWMLPRIHEDSHSARIVHLLESPEMISFFIGAVEALFSWVENDTPQSEDSILLGELFTYFWSHLFCGITIEQLHRFSVLNSRDFAVQRIIWGEFSKANPDLADGYRTLIAVESHDTNKIYQRWLDTFDNPEAFRQEFIYRGSADKSRWNILISCGWCKNLDKEAIVEQLIRHSGLLNMAAFLRDLSDDLGVIFSENPYFAQKVVTHPDLLRLCRFTIKDFRNWNSAELLLKVISDGYDCRLLSDISNEDIQNALPGFIYLNNVGRYVVRDPSGIVREGSFREIPNLGFDKIDAELQNMHFKNQLLCLSAENGHTSSHPLLHKITGFVPEDFYQLVLAEHKNGVKHFSGQFGFLSSFLPKENKNGQLSYDYTTRFLIHTWSSAPVWIQRQLDGISYTLPPMMSDEKILWTAQGRVNYKIESEAHAAYLKKENARLLALSSLVQDSVSAQAYVRALKEANAELLKRSYTKVPAYYPYWLIHAIEYCHRYKLMELKECLTTFLGLPGNKPTTKELLPQRILLKSYFELLFAQILTAPMSLMEYLIDLCHYEVVEIDEKMRVSIIYLERSLVVRGIHEIYKVLVKEKALKLNDEKVKRFICLLCSATELLEPELPGKTQERNPAALLSLFNTSVSMRDQVCQWLLVYNLAAMPVSQAPAVVRLQLILLRSFSESPESESAKKCVPAILWQLSCVPKQVIENIHNTSIKMSSTYQWDGPILKRLLSYEAGVVSLLRYPSLTLQLKEEDLLIFQDSFAVARACLFYVHLTEKLSDEAIVVFAKKMGFDNEDLEDVARKMKNELSIVIEGNRRLDEWVESILQPRSSLGPLN